MSEFLILLKKTPHSLFAQIVRSLAFGVYLFKSSTKNRSVSAASAGLVGVGVIGLFSFLVQLGVHTTAENKACHYWEIGEITVAIFTPGCTSYD